ncbi:MAG: acyltransferase [Bacteroidales bacterium]|jgi:phenylacetate-coenzyme A ligase PaaK-like adenylate-forming protein
MRALEKRIFEITDEKCFADLAFEVFKFQYHNCEVYKCFVDNLKINISDIKNINNIPFLPVEFFKEFKIISGDDSFQEVFSSSGTSSISRSKHYIKNILIYEKSFLECFKLFYGNIEEYCILALLPSYLERQDSSLVYMVKKLIELSKNKNNGFYLHNTEELANKLNSLIAENKKVILFGVSYALMDFADEHKIKLKNTVVIETGGMKGRKKEIIREELHNKLCESFGVNKIHSEYGMTELLSQAYSKGDGIFESPPWMKVLIRDINDPMNIGIKEKTGGINIIDLANIYSCSFISTQDSGIFHINETFEVTGRIDNSDIRGCNLLV